MVSKMDPYACLAAAILEQACKDRDKDFLCDENNLALAFFPEMSGEALYNQTEENYKKYGYYSPLKKKELEY